MFKLINLYAFDPNITECLRLQNLPHHFSSATYLPFAIAGENAQFTLYKTYDPFCWSLLEPDSRRLRRFSFGSKFEVEGVENLQAKPLNEVDELQYIDPDVIKSDTQGLELSILSSSSRFIESAFVIEVETGIYHNYKHETTFCEISDFLQKNHFRLFHVNTNHRVSRKNHFSNKTHHQEIMWCESLWIKDYISYFENKEITLSRPKALKALILCANHGCIDYGLELSILFFDNGLITSKEFEACQLEKSWYLAHQNSLLGQFKRLLKKMLRILPNRVLREIADTILEVSHTDYPLKNILKK